MKNLGSFICPVSAKISYHTSTFPSFSVLWTDLRVPLQEQAIWGLPVKLAMEVTHLRFKERRRAARPRG